MTAAAPLHLPCVCAATRRAARVLTGVYDQELRPVGVPATQFGLLAAIDRHPGATQEQLGTRLAMEQSTLSRNLKGLARKRWVAGHPEPGTPPVAHYATTAAGRAALRRARPAWQRAQARVKRALGADWHAMGRLLDKLATLPPP